MTFISSRWQELGYSDEAARGYYHPEQAAPEALAALQAGGLLQRDAQGRWLRRRAFERRGIPLFSYQSPFQKIEFFQAGDSQALFLNGTIQLEGRETQHHNEMMVAVPLSLIRSPRRVLILGGGLGMGARVALKFAELESIEVVEIDGDVLRLAQQTRSLRRLNNKSLLHPKVRAIQADAFEFMAGSRDLYDLIVFDCDLTATRQSEDLEVEDLVKFFREVLARLQPGGCVSTRIPIDDHYMELVERARPGPDTQSDLERAEQVVEAVWPGAISFEFLSVYCGRELFVFNFPSGRPRVCRRLEGGSSAYQRVLQELFE